METIIGCKIWNAIEWFHFKFYTNSWVWWALWNWVLSWEKMSSLFNKAHSLLIRNKSQLVHPSEIHFLNNLSFQPLCHLYEPLWICLHSGEKYSLQNNFCLNAALANIFCWQIRRISRPKKKLHMLGWTKVSNSLFNMQSCFILLKNSSKDALKKGDNFGL